MKLEFIKEVKPDSTIFYYTKANDIFVEGSLSLDEDVARVMFDNIVKTKQVKPVETVLKTVIIEESVDN
jgi:hypothetical protein